MESIPKRVNPFIWIIFLAIIGIGVYYLENRISSKPQEKAESTLIPSIKTESRDSSTQNVTSVVQDNKGANQVNGVVNNTYKNTYVQKNYYSHGSEKPASANFQRTVTESDIELIRAKVPKFYKIIVFSPEEKNCNECFKYANSLAVKMQDLGYEAFSTTYKFDAVAAPKIEGSFGLEYQSRRNKHIFTFQKLKVSNLHSVGGVPSLV